MAVITEDRDVRRLIHQVCIDARLSHRDDVMDVPGRDPTGLAVFAPLGAHLSQQRYIPRLVAVGLLAAAILRKAIDRNPVRSGHS